MHIYIYTNKNNHVNYVPVQKYTHVCYSHVCAYMLTEASAMSSQLFFSLIFKRISS